MRSKNSVFNIFRMIWLIAVLIYGYFKTLNCISFRANIFKPTSITVPCLLNYYSNFWFYYSNIFFYVKAFGKKWCILDGDSGTHSVFMCLMQLNVSLLFSMVSMIYHTSMGMIACSQENIVFLYKNLITHCAN